MNLARTLLAAVAVTVFGSVWGYVTCGWLFNWVYMLPPVSIWRAPVEMTPLFWVIHYLGCFILSLIFVIVLKWIARGLPGTWLVKGLAYGFIAWLLGTLPGMFGAGLFMSVNPLWPIYSSINQLVAQPLAGLIAASIALPRRTGE